MVQVAKYQGPLCLFHPIHHINLAVFYKPNSTVFTKQEGADHSRVIVSGVVKVAAGCSGQHNTKVLFEYSMPHIASIFDEPNSTIISEQEEAGHSRVIVSRVVEVVADGGGQQDAQVLFAHLLPKATQLYHAVHHLTHAETVAEVVERIVSVVLLHAQLETQTKQRGLRVPE